MTSRELDLPAAQLLQPLPSETLFSLCSRQHRLWGFANGWQTNLLLFGARRAGTQHDFPSGLERLASRTFDKWGSAEALASQRTLLRFYRPFLDEQQYASAVACMRGESVAHLKFRLGLLTSRFRANHALKACKVCMREDRRVYGWAYWRREHQYPGVWVCTLHGAALLESRVKSTGVGRFEWHLPNEDTLRSLPCRTTRMSVGALHGLARFVCAVVDRPAPVGWLDGAIAHSLVEGRFEERDWFTPGGRLKLDTIARDFEGYCSELRGPDELRPFPVTLDVAKAQVGRLRRSLLDGTHPLRVLVVLAWLFSDVDALHSAIQSCHMDTEEPRAAVPAVLTLHGPHQEAEKFVVDAIRQGQSARSAATAAGVAIATAIGWAANVGLSVARRPKLLKAPRLAAVIADLLLGMDKGVVANRHGVSVETVTRVLQTEVGLRGKWRQARWESAQSSAREAWTLLQEDHPGVGVKLLRALAPSSYAWLYRHDRGWLKDHTQLRQIVNPPSRRGAVDWRVRDVVLASGVEEAVLKLADLNPGKKLRLWEIYQAFPDLKPKLRALHRLPLTASLLERTLGRSMPGARSGDLFE